MALSCSSVLDITMALGWVKVIQIGKAPVLAQPSFSCMATGSNPDAVWASLWPLKATWVTEVNTDPGCGGTKDPDRPLVAAWAHTLPCP